MSLDNPVNPYFQLTYWKDTFSSAGATINAPVLSLTQRVKEVVNNSSSLAQAVCIARHSFSHLSKFSQAMGALEAGLDLAQTIGSIHFFYKTQTHKFADLDTLFSASFGVANFANAALWLRQHNLDVLGGSVLSIGTTSLDKILTGAVILGFSGMAYSAYQQMQDAKGGVRYYSGAIVESGPNNKVLSHKVWQLAWSVGELALIILPLANLTSAPTALAYIVVKAVGIQSFLAQPKKERS